MKKIFSFTWVVFWVFFVTPTIAKTTTAVDISLPKKIDIQQLPCVGKVWDGTYDDAVYSDAAAYDNSVARYHGRSILNHWFPLAIQQAKKRNKNTTYVPYQAFISPDCKRLALLTTNYRNHKVSGTNYVRQTTVFIIENGRIKQFSNDADIGANYLAMWLLTGWVDNLHLNLEEAPYDLGAGGSSVISKFASLNVATGKQTEIQYVRGVPYKRGWYLLAADPFLPGKQDNRLGFYGTPPAGTLNFYLFNAKTGKCVLIHSIDVSKQAAPALRISSVPGSTDSNNICNSIDGNSIIKNINTIYVGWDSSFLVPSISNIKKSKEGVSIKYQYKLKKTSLLHTATLFVTHKVVNQLEEKLNK